MGALPHVLPPSSQQAPLRKKSRIMETWHLGKEETSPYFTDGETEAGRNRCPRLPGNLSDRTGVGLASPQPQITPDFPWGVTLVGQPHTLTLHQRPLRRVPTAAGLPGMHTGSEAAGQGGGHPACVPSLLPRDELQLPEPPSRLCPFLGLSVSWGESWPPGQKQRPLT